MHFREGNHTGWYKYLIKSACYNIISNEFGERKHETKNGFQENSDAKQIHLATKIVVAMK